MFLLTANDLPAILNKSNKDSPVLQWGIHINLLHDIGEEIVSSLIICRKTSNTDSDNKIIITQDFLFPIFLGTSKQEYSFYAFIYLTHSLNVSKDCMIIFLPTHFMVDCHLTNACLPYDNHQSRKYESKNILVQALLDIKNNKKINK